MSTGSNVTSGTVTSVTDEFLRGERRRVSCQNRLDSSLHCHLPAACVGVKTNPHSRVVIRHTAVGGVSND